MDKRTKPDPTLSEIAAACLQIRSTWTAAEEAYHRTGPHNKGLQNCPAEIEGPWAVPTLPADLAREIE